MTYISRKLPKDFPGDEAELYGRGNRKLDEKFQALMQKAIADGKELPRVPSPPTDPRDCSVRARLHGATYVPTASSIDTL